MQKASKIVRQILVIIFNTVYFPRNMEFQLPESNIFENWDFVLLCAGYMRQNQKVGKFCERTSVLNSNH